MKKPDTGIYRPLFGPKSIQEAIGRSEQCNDTFIPITRWTEGARSLAIMTLIRDINIVEDSMDALFAAYGEQISAEPIVRLENFDQRIAEKWRYALNSRVYTEFGFPLPYNSLLSEGAGDVKKFHDAVKQGYLPEEVWGWYVILEEGGIQWAIVQDPLEHLAKWNDFESGARDFSLILHMLQGLPSSSVTRRDFASVNRKIESGGSLINGNPSLFYRAECPAHNVIPQITTNIILNMLLITYRNIPSVTDCRIPLCDQDKRIRSVSEMINEFQDKHELLPHRAIRIIRPSTGHYSIT